MRYRLLDKNGDYVFGQGPSEFLVNSPETVAQAVKTVMQLALGEWFLDQTLGVPYLTEILGHGTIGTYDLAIQSAILGTQGVQSITLYNSSLNTATRVLTVQVNLNTIYGSTSTIINQVI